MAAFLGPQVRTDQIWCRMRNFGNAHTCRSVYEDRVKRAEAQFFAVPTASSARDALKRYTDVHHLAGEDADYKSALSLLSEWSQLLDLGEPDNASASVFDAGTPEARHHMTGDWNVELPGAGARVWADTYSVWLDQPVQASLSLAPPSETDDPSPQATWVAKLDEDVLDQDPSSKHGMPPFHGYSFSGNASARVLYAGYGRKSDFERLEQLGISFKGKIVLVRYGALFRGLKVRAAQEVGAVGVLIYSDPAEDGPVTEANNQTAYPDGPARQPSSVQRGSVQALSFYPGDPATPGKPSYRNATRIDREKADSLPKIPSIPISWKTAQRLLQSIEGNGMRAADVDDGMVGAVPGVEYWTGPSSEVAHMDNQMDFKTRDIWNVYAVIPGMIDDERIIVGNHRDAWTFGAADPSSGTAVVHEVIRGIGHLRRQGWKPLRTIVFASWDAEEYGLVGSTEFGEDYADFLQNNTATYFNVDVAVAGGQLEANASPSLATMIKDIASEVPSPESRGKNLTLSEIGPLGSGSDFTVFLQRLGIASSDMNFARGPTDPVYHYHSNYDSFYWTDKFGDPTFQRHEALAKMLGLMLLRTVQPPVLPIDTVGYSREMLVYYRKLVKLAEAANTPIDLDELHLNRIEHAILDVERAAAGLEHRRSRILDEFNTLVKEIDHSKQPSRTLLRRFSRVIHKLHRVNIRLRDYERGFIDKKGLRDRNWYRHLGVAPGRWLGYGATTFPGVTECFTLDHGEHAEEEVERLVEHIRNIAHELYW